MIIPDKCKKLKNDKILAFSENQKRFYILNKRRYKIEEIMIDGCVYSTTSDIERCDVVYFVKNTNTAIYVELKGKDVSKACRQIITTYRNIHGNFICSDTYGCVIHSSIPKMTAKIQKLKKQLQTNGITPLFKSRYYEFSIG